MKTVVAAFNQEMALVGAFSVITNLRMDLFEALVVTDDVLPAHHGRAAQRLVDGGHLGHGTRDQGGASVGDGLAPALAERALNRGM